MTATAKVFTGTFHRVQRGHGKRFVAEPPPGPVRQRPETDWVFGARSACWICVEAPYPLMGHLTTGRSIPQAQPA